MYITTHKSMIAMLIRDANHPKFMAMKEITADWSPDSGLLDHKIEQRKIQLHAVIMQFDTT